LKFLYPERSRRFAPTVWASPLPGLAGSAVMLASPSPHLSLGDADHPGNRRHDFSDSPVTDIVIGWTPSWTRSPALIAGLALAGGAAAGYSLTRPPSHDYGTVPPVAGYHAAAATTGGSVSSLGCRQAAHDGCPALTFAAWARDHAADLR
jgi:hypothetical protein